MCSKLGIQAIEEYDLNNIPEAHYQIETLSSDIIEIQVAIGKMVAGNCATDVRQNELKIINELTDIFSL